MKKLYWAIFIIVAVGVAVALLYVINKPTPDALPVVVKPVTQKQSTTAPSSVATSSPSGTSGWQTYTNSQYGFSFKYPSSWTDAGKSIDNEDFFTAPPKIEIFEISSLQPSDFELLPSLASENIANREISENSCPGDSIIQTTSNGTLFVLNCSSGTENYDYVFTHDSNIILLSYHDDFSESLPVTQKITTLNQIISTIQFTQSQTSTTSIVGWKTYANSQYGFSFQYPQPLTYSENLDGNSLSVGFTQPETDKGFSFYINNPGIGVEGYNTLSNTNKTINGIQMQETVFGDSSSNSPTFIMYQFNKDNNGYIFFVNLDNMSQTDFENMILSFKFAN